jgi:hypothetical protein
MDQLVRPRRVFIDTGHLINMVDVGLERRLRGNQPVERTAAYRQLRELLQTGHCTPLYYEPSAYEWVHGNPLQPALQIAAVLDGALSVKRMLPSPAVFVVEAMQEFQRMDPKIPFPRVELIDDFGRDDELSAWFSEAWPQIEEGPQKLPILFDHQRSGPTVSNVVRALHDHVRRSPDLWQTALEGERIALEGTRKTLEKLGGRGAVPERVRRHWLRSAHFLDKVLQRIAPSADVDGLLAGINLDACPAIQLKLDAYWCYAKANRAPKPGDMIDLMMFAGLPYADFALIENRMHEYVRQARPEEAARRWFRDPIDFVAAITAQQ